MPGPAVAYLMAHHNIPDIPAKDKVQVPVRPEVSWAGAGAEKGMPYDRTLVDLLDAMSDPTLTGLGFSRHRIEDMAPLFRRMHGESSLGRRLHHADGGLCP